MLDVALTFLFFSTVGDPEFSTDTSLATPCVAEYFPFVSVALSVDGNLLTGLYSCPVI